MKAIELANRIEGARRDRPGAGVEARGSLRVQRGDRRPGRLPLRACRWFPRSATRSDVTLADLAARSLPLTPSEAGELCVPDLQEIRMHLDRLAERHKLAGDGLIRNARERLTRLSDRPHDRFGRSSNDGCGSLAWHEPRRAQPGVGPLPRL